ncbi:hypothetical protein CLU81_4788 [Flavobacterium sp. 9]|nr:hypothetical protein CLU81_4788 [Flavobacterium sp. 9]
MNFKTKKGYDLKNALRKIRILYRALFVFRKVNYYCLPIEIALLAAFVFTK